MGGNDVLVAGRSGQVATALMRLAPSEFSVVALGRPQLDLSDRNSIEVALEELRPRIVINAAAYTAVDAAEKDAANAFAVNATGAGQLAEAAAGAGIPILHLSTDYVFDGTKSSRYVESDPVAPLGVYGRSKLLGEEVVLAANTRAYVFRTAWVFSETDKNFARTMLRVADQRDEVAVVHDQYGNPTYAQDIAEALWRVVASIVGPQVAPTPGIYHMTAQGDATWAEFAEEIFSISDLHGGPTARVKRITTAEYPTLARRPANSRLDGGKLSTGFGIVLPHWRVGTKNCVKELIKTEGWKT